MKLKSILAAAMVSLLAVGAIAGCGGEKSRLPIMAKRYRLNIGTWLPKALAALLLRNWLLTLTKSIPISK